MQTFQNIISFVHGALWDYILIFGLVGLGLYMTARLKFPQSRVFPALKKMIADIIAKKPVEEGKMTPFQSLSTAVAAQVGTGNIVGVATAVADGGPGSAFWMILSAFFGMSTIFSEAVLAQKYRETKNGELVGGPAYYIQKGLKSNLLAKIFAIFCILGLGVVGIMVQSNSVVVSLNDSFGLPKVLVTVVLVVTVAVILVGGMGRIASFSEKVVPVMAFAYIAGSLVIVIANIGNLLPAIQSIFVGAFTPQAIRGGALGITIREAIKFGVARGLFSNEAGMGSTPHSHAVADADHPAEQGFVAMIGVFIATFIICLSTVMVVLTSGAYEAGIPANLMTQQGFEMVFTGFGSKFVSVSLTLFSLTTIVGWYFFAESNVKFLFGEGKVVATGAKILALIFLAFGAYVITDSAFLWTVADVFMGLMALPNVIALFILTKESVAILKDYDAQKASNQALHWEFDNE